jgi:hypothetical protein
MPKKTDFLCSHYGKDERSEADQQDLKPHKEKKHPKKTQWIGLSGSVAWPQL